MKSALAMTTLAAAIWLNTSPASAQSHEPHREHRVVMLHTDTSQGRLGAQVMHMTGELREFFGAPKNAGLLVSKVLKDSPAKRAGVRVGDVLTEVNGKSVERFRDVLGALSGKKKGDKVAVVVVRNKRKVTLRAALDQDVPEHGHGHGHGHEHEFDIEHLMPDGMQWKEHGPGHAHIRKKIFGGPANPELGKALKELRERMQKMEKRLEKLEKRR